MQPAPQQLAPLPSFNATVAILKAKVLAQRLSHSHLLSPTPPWLPLSNPCRCLSFPACMTLACNLRQTTSLYRPIPSSLTTSRCPQMTLATSIEASRHNPLLHHAVLDRSLSLLLRPQPPVLAPTLPSSVEDLALSQDSSSVPSLIGQEHGHRRPRFRSPRHLLPYLSHPSLQCPAHTWLGVKDNVPALLHSTTLVRNTKCKLESELELRRGRSLASSSCTLPKPWNHPRREETGHDLCGMNLASFERRLCL
jgi:hypothetical protein